MEKQNRKFALDAANQFRVRALKFLGFSPGFSIKNTELIEMVSDKCGVDLNGSKSKNYETLMNAIGNWPSKVDTRSQVVPKRYPTRMYITCPSCGHQGEAAIFLEDVGKLKCSKCGNNNPNVGDREPMRSWANERRTGRKSIRK